MQEVRKENIAIPGGEMPIILNANEDDTFFTVVIDGVEWLHTKNRMHAIVLFEMMLEHITEYVQYETKSWDPDYIKVTPSEKRDMDIGTKIKKIRNEKCITQKQLAAFIGIDDATIRKYESGELHPKDKTIKSIAKGLGVSPSYLTERDYEKIITAQSLKLRVEQLGGTITTDEETGRVHIIFEPSIICEWYNNSIHFRNDE